MHILFILRKIQTAQNIPAMLQQQSRYIAETLPNCCNIAGNFCCMRKLRDSFVIATINFSNWKNCYNSGLIYNVAEYVILIEID